MFCLMEKTEGKSNKTHKFLLLFTAFWQLEKSFTSAATLIVVTKICTKGLFNLLVVYLLAIQLWDH
jgi:hypothetical protein